jgi:uncharacterized lipoprotein NlpE involved in copper resistance
MKKLITLMVIILLFLGCTNWDNLTEEEKEAYRRGRAKYEASQGP